MMRGLGSRVPLARALAVAATALRPADTLVPGDSRRVGGNFRVTASS
jgi:hypothetical protein